PRGQPCTAIADTGLRARADRLGERAHSRRYFHGGAALTMADLRELVRYMDATLRTSEVPDSEHALNGLQLSNSGNVARIAAAVDFSANSVAGAVRDGAQLLLVHHGIFWR